MHILEIPSFFPPYGGRFCLDQALALADRGNEVRILACIQLGITITPQQFLTLPYRRHWQTMEGIEVFTKYMRGIPCCNRPNQQRWVSTVRSMFRAYVERHGCPDIIHSHCMKWAGYAAMLIAKEYGIPYIITEHCSREVFLREFGAHSEGCWQVNLLKETLRSADLVVPVSEELVENLAPIFGKEYHYKAISNTIDTAFWTPRQRNSAGPYEFIYPAINVALKDHPTLLRAFRKVREQLPDAILHLAGRGTEQVLTPAEAAEQGIVCHGELSKEALRELFYHCHCMVLASRSEAQPLVCLEAAASGMPFVATEVIPQSLRISAECPIVSIGDADGMAQAMLLIASKYEAANGTTGNEKASVAFDADILYKKVKDIASPTTVGTTLDKELRAILERRK